MGSTYQGSTVVVTGGAGFIGSALSARLVALGARVVVVDTLRHGNKLPEALRPRVELHVCDVRDRLRLAALTAGADCVFHLAAILGVEHAASHPLETMETEVMGMHSVANAVAASRVPTLVYASSSSVYASSPDGTPATETSALAPTTGYAAAKHYGEVCLRGLCGQAGVSGVALRFFNVYGPRQDERMVIPRFIGRALRGEPLTVYGDGAQTRDFTFVDDAVEAALRAARAASGFDVLNVCTGRETPIGRIATLVREASGGCAELRHAPVPEARHPFETRRRIGSADELEARTGYRPTTTLEEGLAATWHALSGSGAGGG